MRLQPYNVFGLAHLQHEYQLPQLAPMCFDVRSGAHALTCHGGTADPFNVKSGKRKYPSLRGVTFASGAMRGHGHNESSAGNYTASC